MKVRFEDIPEEGLQVEITDESWFPKNEVEHVGPVRAKFFLEKNEHTVLVDGHLQATTVQECDRCVERYELPLDLHFRIDLELSEGGEGAEEFDADHAVSDSEMDVIILEEPEIDLGSLLEQQVFLALPAKRLCRPDCKGLCPVCGTNLNEKSCGCTAGKISSPFAVLEKLKGTLKK